MVKLKSKNEMHMGIVAETYAGVIRLGQTDADIEIMWSVPESNWQFPNCPDINNCAKWWVPLKTVLEIPRPDNTTLQLTYVYYDYKTKIDDPEIFQLPRGVACQFLKQTLPFPTNLPIHFEAGVEIYFPFSESQITAKERIYYNMDRKIIRVDLDLPSDLTESKDVGLDREIWDYNTQVIYKMHVKNGSCTVEKMSQDDVAMGVKKKTSVGILNSLMSENVDPTSFFYIGKRLYRSMLCDVWIANLTETPTEIYMFNETAKNEDGIQLKYSVPVFLNLSQSSDIAGEMEIQTSGMSIFNYDLNVPNWSRFDTTSCFIEDNKIRFQILLKGQYTGVIDENPNDFILQIQKQLASQTKILPNRFQEIMIDNFQAPNETSTILFTTTLVENPFNAGHIGTNTYDEKNNPKVYENLTETIYTKKLTFIFKTAGKSYSYRAVEIRDDVVSIPTTSLKGELGYITGRTQSWTGLSQTRNHLLIFSLAEIGHDDIKESFQKKAAAVITKGFDFSTSGISRMECFENCVDSIEFDCRSWSFCKDTGGCILSSVLAEHGKDEEFEYKEHTNCEFYTRNFLKDYVLNRDTVTEAFGIEIGVTLEPNTEEECAKQCSTDKLSFYCEGFDSCTDPNSGKKTCYFRTRHILEMEPTSIKKSETCHHYTSACDYSQSQWKNSAIV
uniref:LolA-like domain-containing protein n=1 Tax=Strigamia maritima TaxID=126957 RepID=T1IYR6_STRMM